MILLELIILVIGYTFALIGFGVAIRDYLDNEDCWIVIFILGLLFLIPTIVSHIALTIGWEWLFAEV